MGGQKQQPMDLMFDDLPPDAALKYIYGRLAARRRHQKPSPATVPELTGLIADIIRHDNQRREDEIVSGGHVDPRDVPSYEDTAKTILAAIASGNLK